ncbi:hypothetical protein PV10_05309 [Exophiala mesophila]|uniref:Uncharacterized protein n=1 Tax=Exophiala mesophila TaxID=212818 RepID=A0A0D1WNQ7_EXOME|nr:uncharacterized protein PV10_05309 [Exophiala mesophila]KIV90680.1 hypothetical protein PV10_05309 [Exophiala mesophila]
MPEAWVQPRLIDSQVHGYGACAYQAGLATYTYSISFVKTLSLLGRVAILTSPILILKRPSSAATSTSTPLMIVIMIRVMTDDFDLSVLKLTLLAITSQLGHGPTSLQDSCNITAVFKFDQGFNHPIE